MAFFTALGAALLTGAYASSLLPQDKAPAVATHTDAREQPPLSLSWAPSWLMTIINNAVADTFDPHTRS